MTSSGYGSQAVSTLTLSSEDSASIKSMEEQIGVTAAGDLRPHRKLTSAEHSADSEEMEEATGEGNQSQLTERSEEEAESCDHYSENAMEELERLKQNEEENDECGDKYSQLQSSSQAVEIDGQRSAMSSSPSPLPPLPPTVVTPRNKGGKSSPLSSSLSPSSSPTPWEGNSTSGKKIIAHGGGNRRKGSGVRPRPMSMVVSPQAEILTRAWQEDSDSCPGSSEEHLGGKV